MNRLCGDKEIDLKYVFFRRQVRGYRKKNYIPKLPRNVFEVDKIVGHRYYEDEEDNQMMEFKIRWLNYTEVDDTWEPRHKLINCSEILKDYLYEVTMNGTISHDCIPEEQEEDINLDEIADEIDIDAIAEGFIELADDEPMNMDSLLE